MKKLLILLIPIAIWSCKKDEDTKDVTAPVISDLTVYDTHVGDTVTASLKITDNESLSSVKIEIHNDLDNHSHRTTQLDLFFYQKTINLTGKIQLVDLKVPVPVATTSGEYHFTAKALDASGNESTLKVAPFVIDSNAVHQHQH